MLESGLSTSVSIINPQEIHLPESNVKTIKLKITKTIIPELQNLNIPEYVKLKANEIFVNQNLSLRKGKKLPHILFYCVYKAYRQLGESQVPKKIATLVGLPHNEISKAVSMFSSPNANSDSKLNSEGSFSSFVQLIPCYCEDLGINNRDTITEIQRFGQQLLDMNSDLDEKFPQNIAAGVILYWMSIHGYEIDRKGFQAKVQLSDVTISNAFKLVKSVHNSLPEK